MGVYSALSVGNTALLTSQKALEVVGNNIANATTPNYSRQHVGMVPGRSVGMGELRVGTGVRLTGVERRFDAAVESRLRDAISQSESAAIQKQALDRLEALYNETTDVDLSSALVGFFNSFNDLANNPQDLGVRTIVMEKARGLVNEIVRIRGSADNLRQELDSMVRVTVDEINRLAQEIANLNVQVILAEEGRLESAPGLRDERDAKVRELSALLDVRGVEQNSGAVNIIVGNQILVDGRYCRQLAYEVVEDRNLGVSEVHFTDNDELLSLTGGALQGYIYGRDQWVGQQIDTLDQLAQTLIFEVNALHAEGTGTVLPQTVRSQQFVLDSSAALNGADAGLHFTPVNGSFLLHVTNATSGLTETLTVDVDLDGAGADDSLDDVAARINALAAAEGMNVAASVDTTGHLIIQGTSGEMRVSFSDDSSRLLACLGMNALFTGFDSVTMGLSSEILDDPRLLAAGLTGTAGDNANALRLADLADQKIDDLGGITIPEYHTQAATRLAVSAAAAQSSSTAADAFLAAMSDERESICGVNLDEEAVNLIRYQKMYQAAARFMSLMADLMDTLMDI